VLKRSTQQSAFSEIPSAARDPYHHGNSSDASEETSRMIFTKQALFTRLEIIPAWSPEEFINQ
jgi:hypothetical protein